MVYTEPTVGLEPCSPLGVRFTCFSLTSHLFWVPLHQGVRSLISSTSVCALESSHGAKGLAGRSRGASAGILPLGHQLSVPGRTSLIPGRNPFGSDYSINFPMLPMKAQGSFHAMSGLEDLSGQNCQQVDHRVLYQPSFPPDGPS